MAFATLEPSPSALVSVAVFPGKSAHVSFAPTVRFHTGAALPLPLTLPLPLPPESAVATLS